MVVYQCGRKAKTLEISMGESQQPDMARRMTLAVDK